MSNSALLFVCIAVYLAIGLLCWRRIVLTPTPCEPSGGEEWRRDIIAADARGDISLLIVKGTFIPLWPLVLIFGWSWARLT